jgi:site-specific DNA-methyltransferase (adenine-specific)
MITKTLTKKEVERGFLYIPIKNRVELLGATVPFDTTVNNLPAKVDEYGRLWSDYLKGKFAVDTQVTIDRNSNGFEIKTLENRYPEVAKAGQDYPSVIPYFEANSVSLFNEDTLTTKAIKENSVNLIVTSPPYCVSIDYEKYDDKIPYPEYKAFTRKWLERCYAFSKDDGRLCLNIPLDKNKGGQQSVYADITTIAKEVGWKYQSTIIWNEQNISRRTAWGSWLSASAPFVIAPVEVIVVLYKKFWGRRDKGKSDINKEDFIAWTNGVWSFNGESKRRIGHPAPFPMELPKRCIKLFSYVDDTVLDPFAGSGTTLLACIETNRKGIGIEIDQNYCALAVRRLKDKQAQKTL